MPVPLKVPENIVVHLGVPDDYDAPNVTVPFVDYIKNVASSEIYPTWPEESLKANILAQITFALNRVFSEHYISQGYPFHITSVQQFDQAYVNDRDYFENISKIVDEIFNSYLTREGFYNPLYARYCNGTTSTCPGGLSQWGTVDLANQGYDAFGILQYYYGDDIVLIENAPIEDIRESYPGTPLRLGDINDLNVRRIQTQLNRISTNYPSIPKILIPDGNFDVITEDAVKEFQRVFNLAVDGVVGKATWYKINRIYAAVKRIAELDAEAIALDKLTKQFSGVLEKGDSDQTVEIAQYYLDFIATFNDYIPQLVIDGVFGDATEHAVRVFQGAYGLPVTGKIDEDTWNELFSVYYSILNVFPEDYTDFNAAPYPGSVVYRGVSGEEVTTLQTYLAEISKVYPEIPTVPITGYYGPETQEAVLAYQNAFNLPPRGIVGPLTWESISETYSDVTFGSQKSEGQYPGYVLAEE